MEIIQGKITDFCRDGTIVIRAKLPDILRACEREYSEVQVGLPDARTISPVQRRKAWALMGEIAAWSGDSPDHINLILKHRFMKDALQSMEKELFSLSNCDITTAREYISYLIDFILAYDIPTATMLCELCDDVERYVYACLIHRKCAVCGRKAELHHVDRVGMGRDRHDICHIGMEALPLCEEHHRLNGIHQMGDERFMDKYHLAPVKIDEKVAKVYRLRKDKSNEQNHDHRQPDQQR